MLEGDTSGSPEETLAKVAESHSGGSDFRDRRLSVAQVADPSARGATRDRKLSIYDQEAELEGGFPVSATPMSTCGCKSIGGLEPVPGGSTAKINQDRALSVYPFMGEKVRGGPCTWPGGVGVAG